MLLSDIKLQYLETFKLVASSGSLKHAAKETGVSKSTVSYHLKSLEDQLNVQLLDHSHRPMRLTAAGKNFVRYVDEMLAVLRKAEADITMEDVVNIRSLRMAQTHEFDSDIAPNLAVFLATRMPKCEFSLHARSSNEILDMLENRMLDFGIGSRPPTLPEGLEEYQLLNDPFVLAVPISSQASPSDFLQGKVDLPFLRFYRDQLISTQIDTQLRRLRVSLPSRFEFESHQSMMAVVAAGLGWTITTPLGYTRAQRFQKAVRLCKFPDAAFSRTFSLFVTREHSDAMAQIVAQTFRSMIKQQLIQPMLQQHPWLAGSLSLIDD
ncbi:LysR family transcriptional regulator [Roseovarius aestuarii]|nr:LysR family transcriptional regulator [Roseovarius aestuarii]